MRLIPYRFVGESLPCNLCGERARHVVGRVDRSWLPLRNVLCDVCGLVFLDPMPTSEEIARYYRNEYRERYHGSGAPRPKAILRDERGAVERMRLLAPWLTPGSRVLDVGAGTGAFVAAAARAGLNAVGVEPHQGFAAHAQRHYGAAIHATLLEDAPLEDASFDLVTSSHVFEHLRDPLAAFARVHRLLVAGGIFHVAVPDISNPDRTPIALWHFGHVHGFTRRSLMMMALKAGFAPEAFDDGTPTLVLRKLDQALPWFVFPHHARDMRQFFDRHTMWRHLLSATPYRKFVRRMARFRRERAALKH